MLTANMDITKRQFTIQTKERLPNTIKFIKLRIANTYPNTDRQIHIDTLSPVTRHQEHDANHGLKYILILEL